MILEKAWAKLIGSYKRTEGGTPFWAQSHITGSPALGYVHD